MITLRSNRLMQQLVVAHGLRLRSRTTIALMLPNSAWRSRILLAHTLVMEAVEGQSALNMRGGNDDRHGYETVAGKAWRVEP